MMNGRRVNTSKGRKRQKKTAKSELSRDPNKDIDLENSRHIGSNNDYEAD